MKKLPEITVQFFILVIFALMVFNFALVADRSTSLKVSIALVLFLAVLVVNQLFGEIEPSPRRLSPEAKELYYSEFLSKNFLVRYDPEALKEEVTADVIDYAKARVPVLLVVAAPKSGAYLQRFADDVASGRVQLVEMSVKGEEAAGEGVTKVPVEDLAPIEGILSARAEGSLVVLDSISDIIRNRGFEESVRILEGWLELCGGRGLVLMALLNQDAHKKMEIKAMEDLFQGIARIQQGRLRVLK
ncbi:MAG: hypothetical protein GXO65_05400 [Euryarchaeota archaeon]|nr:hypothetical protein [Euryarchaeota archaeon]